MKIPGIPELRYDRAVLEELYGELAPEDRDDVAIPSYLHGNPLVTGIVAWRMASAMKFLDLAAGRSLLDYGCGTGMLLLQLPPQVRPRFGVDVRPEIARRVLAAH